MAKAATLRKVDSKQVRKAATKTVSAKKKPQLKVVKPSPSKTKRTAQSHKSDSKKLAKKAMKKLVKLAKVQSGRAAKPALKQVVKPVVKQQFKPVQVKKEAPKPVLKKPATRDFRIGDHVVYPTHGVGRIISEETQQIGEYALRMLVIAFEKDRMTLRVPVNRAATAGLRHISGNDQMSRVFVTLKSRARSSRGMWSRRAQEYEAKINSGSVISVAEVVRDLHPNVDQAERSYSERMIYEAALGRLVGELAAAEGMDQKTATDKLMKLLRSKVAA